MKDPLFIWLPEDVAAPWHYAQGGVSACATDAAEKTALAARGAEDCIAIIAGTAVRKLQTTLPKMRESDRLNAAKFAVEEQLGTGLKAQHVVISAPDDAGAVSIAIVSEDVMREALEALSIHGLSPRGVYVDYDMTTAAARFDGRIILPKTIDNPDPNHNPMTLDMTWAEGKDAYATPLDIAQITAVPTTALNLRSGMFARRRSIGGGLSFAGLKLWPIAAMFVAACVVSFVAALGQTRAINLQAQEIRAETARLYSQATGDSAPSNPAVNAMRALNVDPKSSAGFITLSGGLFTIVAQTDGISVDTMRYDPTSGQLSLQLIYPDFDSGSALETLALAQGLSFDARGVREQGGTVRAEATLSILKAAP